MIHEDLRNKLKGSTYNSFSLIVAEPWLRIWNKHYATPKSIISNDAVNFRKNNTGLNDL